MRTVTASIVAFVLGAGTALERAPTPIETTAPGGFTAHVDAAALAMGLAGPQAVASAPCTATDAAVLADPADDCLVVVTQDQDALVRHVLTTTRCVASLDTGDDACFAGWVEVDRALGTLLAD